jgi:hypothetical protein
MEEDPQPLSSHEFINMEEIKALPNENIKKKRNSSQHGNSTKNSHKSQKKQPDYSP